MCDTGIVTCGCEAILDKVIAMTSSNYLQWLCAHADHKVHHHNLTLVQYISPSPEEVDVKPHGNSHSLNPYFRSRKSTLCYLEKVLKSVPLKEAVEQVSKEKGGEMSARSARSLPRNR